MLKHTTLIKYKLVRDHMRHHITLFTFSTSLTFSGATDVDKKGATFFKTHLYMHCMLANQ